MLFYSSPIPNFPPNKAARAPCGGHMNCQRKPCPLTGLWDIFTQLIGKFVFGQEFASEMLCLPNCMPNPVVGINYFAVFFFSPSSKGYGAAPSETRCSWAKNEFSVSVVQLRFSIGFRWNGGRQIIYPRGSSQNKQQSFLTDKGLKGICPLGLNSLLDRALRMTWQIPLRGRGGCFWMLPLQFKQQGMAA